MHQVPTSEFQIFTSKWIKYVMEKNEEIIITNRGVPILTVSPIIKELVDEPLPGGNYDIEYYPRKASSKTYDLKEMIDKNS